MAGTRRVSLYRLARPLLFALDAEQAHDLTLASMGPMAASGALRLAAGPMVDDPVDLLGLRFANRIGLAAGLDKNAAHIDALAQMGFGFIEVGTVTPRPQSGNPRPRIFRLPQRSALINRLGFNNLGLDAFVANLARTGYRGVLGANIGKNADTPLEQATNDYLTGLHMSPSMCHRPIPAGCARCRKARHSKDSWRRSIPSVRSWAELTGAACHCWSRSHPTSMTSALPSSLLPW